MSKTWLNLTVLISLILICFASLWLVFADRPGLASAKEKVTTPLYQPADPAARPALAGFNITVSEIVASGFSRPIQVTHAGDGSGRLFIVEQDGRIKSFQNGVTSTFLDINGLVRSPSDGGGSEEGLLGLAFHPNYESNGYFYVYYNDTDGNIVIARYTASPPSSDTANAGSAVTILPISHPTNNNHNGGQLAFGPLDGYLYISTGDGGAGGDPNENAQNKDSLLGKILRLNVTGVTTYTIPATNPYVGIAGDDRIWAIGLRNPWRFSFDRANGDLYIGDVGQGQWEEISYQAAGTPGGVNFGWDCREGTHPFEPGNCSPSTTLTDPIAEYDHSFGVAVTGGFVYRGSLYLALRGYYFYADFASGRIWSMTKTGPNSWSTPEQELDTNVNISAFGEDEQGEVYVVDYGGAIRRLADASGPSSDLSTSSKSASAPGADPGEVLTYTILLKNTGAPTSQPVTLTDHIPSGLVYVPGSLAATQGSVDDSLNPTLRWQGAFSPGLSITLTYRVTATGAITGILTNQAVVTGPGPNSITLTHLIFVPRPFPAYLPLIYKQ